MLRKTSPQTHVEALLKAGSQLQGRPSHSGGSGIVTLRQLTQWQANIVGRFFNVIGFTFYASQVDSNEQSIINVPATDLWCLSRPGDTVLLSDEITHHYTMIHSIDHASNSIYFLDTWPDRIFLLPGRNVEDISAELVPQPDGTKLVHITKEEFERVVLGVSTLDDLSLLEYYFTINPSASQKPLLYVQFAYAALAAGKNAFVPGALEVLDKGLTIAEHGKDRNLSRWVASRMELALLLALHGISGEERQNFLKAKLAKLHQHYDESLLMGLLSEEDYYLLAGTALRLSQAYLAQNDFEHAISSANSALEYIYVLAEAGEDETDQGDEQSKPLSDDNSKNVTAEKFLSLSETALLTRGIALWFENATENCKATDIMGEGRFLIKTLPRRSSGYTLLGLCQAALHEDVEARANIKRAIELETDEKAIANLKQVLASVGGNR